MKVTACLNECRYIAIFRMIASTRLWESKKWAGVVGSRTKKHGPGTRARRGESPQDFSIPFEHPKRGHIVWIPN